MATWMTHFRITDMILDFLQDLSTEHFIVGSGIAPDCLSATEVTHFTPTGNKEDIDCESFFQTYIKPDNSNTKNSFYLGYYIHLITDILWWNYAWLPVINKLDKDLQNDKEIIKKIKQEWKDTDLLFLYKNPDFRTLKILHNIKIFPNIYIDYYEKDVFENMIKTVSGMYSINSLKINNIFFYYSYDEINNIIIKIVEDIKFKLYIKNIIFSI